MRLYQKISLGFLGSFILLGGLGTFFLHKNFKIQSRNKQAFEQARIETRTVTEVSRSLYLIQAYSQELIMLQELKSSEADKVYYREKIEQELKSLDLNVVKGLNATLVETKQQMQYNSEDLDTQAEDLGNIKQIKIQVGQYKQNLSRFLDLLSEQKISEAKNIYNKHLNAKLQNNIFPLLDDYKDNSLEDIRSAEEIITKQNSESLSAVKSYLLFSWLVSLGLFIYVYYSIYSPLNKIEDNLTWQQAKGTLDTEIERQTNNKNELNNLINVFNSLIWELEKIKGAKLNLEQLINGMGDSLIVINYDKNIEKVNQTALNLLGYEEKELIGQKIHTILEKNTKLDIKELLENEGETIYRTKNNQKIAVAIKCANIFDKNTDRNSILLIARDIQQQPALKKALRESEERYKLALSNTNDGLWEWDLRSKKVTYSQRWLSMLGYEEGEIGNTLREWFDKIGSDDKKIFKQKFVAHLRGKTPQLEVTYQIKHKNGNYLTMFCRASAVRDLNGKISRIIGVQTDLSDRKKIEDRLRYESTHDSLTKLPNRQLLLNQLQGFLDKSIDKARQKSNYLIGVIVIDLDRFKLINDSLGWQAGDRLLIDIAARLSAYFGRENIIARLRGGKFAIVTKKVKDVKEIAILAGEIQKQLTQPFDLCDRQIYLNANIGIAISKQNDRCCEQLLTEAETASAAARSSNKGRIVVFEPSMHVKALDRLKLETDLHRAVSNDELQVHYQPIVELSTNKIIGFEALTRWQHPEQGLISPQEFMPVALEIGAILPITKEIIRQACRQMVRWQKQYVAAGSMFICINVGNLQIVDGNFVECLNDIISETGLNSEQLKLKFSEETIGKDIQAARSRLEQLKVKGLKVSIGNFGRGFSSLAHLHELEIDSLQLDETAIADIDENLVKSEIIDAVIKIASNAKVNVFAEEIENVKQANLLLERGCQYGQGAFFCGAIANEVAEALIASQTNPSDSYENFNPKQQSQDTFPDSIVKYGLN